MMKFVSLILVLNLVLVLPQMAVAQAQQVPDPPSERGKGAAYVVTGLALTAGSIAAIVSQHDKYGRGTGYPTLGRYIALYGLASTGAAAGAMLAGDGVNKLIGPASERTRGAAYLPVGGSLIYGGFRMAQWGFNHKHEVLVSHCSLYTQADGYGLCSYIPYDSSYWHVYDETHRYRWIIVGGVATIGTGVGFTIAGIHKLGEGSTKKVSNKGWRLAVLEPSNDGGLSLGSVKYRW
jgi:hypothetical protein